MRNDHIKLTNVADRLNLPKHVATPNLSEALCSLSPSGELADVDEWDNDDRRHALAVCAARMAHKRNPDEWPLVDVPDWLAERIGLQTAAKKVQEAQNMAESLEDENSPESIRLEVAKSKALVTAEQVSPPETIGLGTDEKPKAKKAAKRKASKKSAKSKAKPAEEPELVPDANVWIDVPGDRYCTGPDMRALIADIWPKGIELDAFSDPLSKIESTFKYDMRDGNDGCKLEWFGRLPTMQNPIFHACRTYANGGYSKKHNPGMAPENWVPHGVKQFLEQPLHRELILMLPCGPGLEYWKKWIWPNATVVFAGKQKFELEGELQPNPRHEVALCYMGHQHARVRNLSLLRGYPALRM